MAKRLSANAVRSQLLHPTDHPDRCRICGGHVVIEDLHREERYPKQLHCERCGAEYGTTRPGVLTY